MTDDPAFRPETLSTWEPSSDWEVVRSALQRQAFTEPEAALDRLRKREARLEAALKEIEAKPWLASLLARAALAHEEEGK